MSRFFIELVAALLVAIIGAFVAAKFSNKFNRQALATERVAAALERAYPTPIREHKIIHCKNGAWAYLYDNETGKDIVASCD